MFKKPKRNFRSRRKNSESGNEDNAESKTENARADISCSNVAEPGKNNLNSRSGNEPVAIVIDDDDATETFNVSESVQSQTSTKQNKSKPGVPRVTSLTSLSSVLSFDTGDHDDAEEAFQIKKSSYSRKIAKQLKKANRREKQPHAIDEDVSSDENMDDKELEGENGVRDIALELTEKDLQDLEDATQEEEHALTPSVQYILQGGQIPDAAMIHLIRKKRQMARETGDDFIAVETDKSANKTTSRLVREEDHDKCEEDERINFSINSREKELRTIQETILAAEEGSQSEGSDHDNEWENQQIRKGVKIGAPVGSEDKYAPSYAAPSSLSSSRLFNVSVPAPMEYGGRRRGDVPAGRGDVTTQRIRTALKERLTEMQAVHRAHTAERDSVASRLADSRACIAALEASGDSAASRTVEVERRYQFFQQTRAYIRDLVDCFNDKVPAIDYIEKGLLAVRRQRAEQLCERQQADVKDQSKEFVSGKGTAAAPVTDDALRQRRVAEREARRSRRRRGREVKYVKEHNEGWSTDDEENYSTTAKYRADRERLLGDAGRLMEDVVDDFSQLACVQARLQRWRDEYGPSYNDAYISLCLPKLFSPLIRLSLVDWSPLEADCEPFEDMPWYQSLMFYGCREGATLSTEHSDIRLMPSIIEKVLLPKLTELADGVWSPLSSQQTRRLVKVVTQLVHDYPTVGADSKNTQALIKAVVERMRKSLDNDVYVPLYPKQVLENRMCGASVFFHRQFTSCVKLLSNLLLWGEVLSPRTQQELALDCLLNRYLLLAFHSAPVCADTINKCCMIASNFPADWFRELTEEKTIPKLTALCKYLVTAAGTLHEASEGGKEGDRKETRNLIKQITKLLVKMNAIDSALSLASLYSLKISRPEAASAR